MKKILFMMVLCIFAYAKDTLVYAISSDITSLDPASANNNESFYLGEQIYNTLFINDGNALQPVLAKSYSISEDGLVYTIKLKEGIYFNANKFFDKSFELDADDVVFSLKRQFDESNPYYSLGIPYIYWNATNLKTSIKDVVATSKYEVKIMLNEPDFSVIYNLSRNFCPIMSKKYADFLLENNRPKDLFNKPYGTGAFSLVTWKKDDRVVLEANPKYFQGSPKIKQLIFKVVPNAVVRVAELKAGSVDLIDMPNLAQIQELKDNKSVKVYEAEGLNVGYMAMNLQRKELSNILVRQAINYAVNKQALIDAAYEGFANLTNSPVPKSMKGYLESSYEYDLEKAKELMKKAGYENGFTLNLWAMPVSRPYMPDAKKVAQIIQSDLAKINIKLEIISFDWGTYLQKASNLEHDLLLLGQTTSNIEAYDMLNTYLNSSSIKAPAENFAAWSNDRFDELMKLAKAEFNEEKRLKLYEEAQRIFAKEVPWLTIANSKVFVVSSEKLKDFELDNTGKRDFSKVYFE